MSQTIINQAREFARLKHSGQTRINGQPYFEHCEAVASLIAIITDDEAAIAAAYLHDVMEDCGVDYTTLVQQFGETVADLVNEVTNICQDEVNRAKRIVKNTDHLAKASPLGMSIKLADIFDNSLNIVEADPAFAEQYLKEKASQIKVLDGGDPFLFATVRDFVKMQRAKLK